MKIFKPDCRQCKFFKLSRGDFYNLSKCQRAGSGSDYADLSRQRECGVDGKLFEQRTGFFTQLMLFIGAIKAPAAIVVPIKQPEFDFSASPPEPESWK